MLLDQNNYLPILVVCAPTHGKWVLASCAQCVCKKALETDTLCTVSACTLPSIFCGAVFGPLNLRPFSFGPHKVWLHINKNYLKIRFSFKVIFVNHCYFRDLQNQYEIFKRNLISRDSTFIGQFDHNLMLCPGIPSRKRKNIVRGQTFSCLTPICGGRGLV